MEQSLPGTPIVRLKSAISEFASNRERRAGAWLLGGGVALVLFKLWLVSAQTIFAIGFADYDDALFIRLANFLAHGEWLGPYDHFTLAKSPMYPLFIAATYLVHVPLFTAQQLLYAAACGWLVAAVRPLVPNRPLRFGLFAVLLFNPVTYDTIIHARVLRQDIIYSLALIIVAGLIALYARRASAPRMLPWSLLTGAALPAFWMTREEAVWLLPCVLILWTAAAVGAWRVGASNLAGRLACLVLPGLMWGAALAVVAGINFRYYGLFTTCELKHPAMKAANGALMRVEPVQWKPFMPVSREMRERLYHVSPAFAALQSEFEGPIGQGWAGITEFLTHRPAEEHEIAGAWFTWALRRAVYDTGHAHNGAEAMAFYRQLAHEINDACDRGLVKAGPPRTGYVPPISREQWTMLPSSLVRMFREIITFYRMSTVPVSPSLGNPQNLGLFAKLSRGRLTPPSEGAPVPPRQRRWDQLRTDILRGIYQVYHWASPWAGGLALIAWFTAAAINLWRRQWGSYFGFVGVGLLGAILALSGIIALIDVTAFPVAETGYFSGSYALWLLFMFSSWFALTEVLRVRPARANAVAVEPASVGKGLGW